MTIMARVYFISWMRDVALSTEPTKVPVKVIVYSRKLQRPRERMAISLLFTGATGTGYTWKNRTNFQTMIIESNRRMDAFQENVQLAINRIMILIYLRSLFCLQISKNRVEFLLIINKHYIFSSKCLVR